MKLQQIQKAFQPLIDAKGRRKLSMRITDLKEYDETKFSPELQNYIMCRQEIQVNLTRLNMEIEKINGKMGAAPEVEPAI